MKRSGKQIIIELNTKDVYKIREAVNSNNNLAIVKKNEYSDGKNKFNYFSWDRICACMDRIDDTLQYLNELNLQVLENKRSAFEFYNFLNHAFVLIDCIKTIALIFEIDKSIIKKVENSRECFGEYSTSGNDNDFFVYIRSLCSVHPVNTTRHRKFFNGANIHCCPYVIWNDRYNITDENKNYELIVRIYNSMNDGRNNEILLKIESFEKYINKWLGLADCIVDAILKYYDKTYEEKRNIQIKGEKCFNDYINYIKYLRSEDGNRFNRGEEYYYNYYISVLS